MWFIINIKIRTKMRISEKAVPRHLKFNKIIAGVISLVWLNTAMVQASSSPCDSSTYKVWEDGNIMTDCSFGTNTPKLDFTAGVHSDG